MTGELGAMFLPSGTTTEEQLRRRRQGDALRVLGLTLPASLGPGSVAPEILLNAPGMAGEPSLGTSGGGPSLASLIAEAVMSQVTGAPQASPSPTSVNPLSALLSGVQAGGGSSPAPTSAVPLTGAQSLTGVVRREAAAPTGSTRVAAPSVTGSASVPVSTPPRVTPRDPGETMPLPTQPQPTPAGPEPGQQPDGSLLTTDPVPNLSDILSMLRMDRTPRQRFGG